MALTCPLFSVSLTLGPGRAPNTVRAQGARLCEGNQPGFGGHRSIAGLVVTSSIYPGVGGSASCLAAYAGRCAPSHALSDPHRFTSRNLSTSTGLVTMVQKSSRSCSYLMVTVPSGCCIWYTAYPILP